MVAASAKAAAEGHASWLNWLRHVLPRLGRCVCVCVCVGGRGGGGGPGAGGGGGTGRRGGAHTHIYICVCVYHTWAGGGVCPGLLGAGAVSAVVLRLGRGCGGAPRGARRRQENEHKAGWPGARGLGLLAGAAPLCKCHVAKLYIKKKREKRKVVGETVLVEHFFLFSGRR